MKHIFKNSKAKSKYQKYIHKQEKGVKLVYPTKQNEEFTRNTIANQPSHDKRLYDILLGLRFNALTKARNK